MQHHPHHLSMLDKKQHKVRGMCHLHTFIQLLLLLTLCLMNGPHQQQPGSLVVCCVVCLDAPAGCSWSSQQAACCSCHIINVHMGDKHVAGPRVPGRNLNSESHTAQVGVGLLSFQKD